MHFIPGCRLRLSAGNSEEAQIVGMDEYDMGEFAYDYVGLEQEIPGEGKDGLGVTAGGREPLHHPTSNHSSTTEEVGEKTATA